MLHVLYIIYIGGVLENFRVKLKKIKFFIFEYEKRTIKKDSPSVWDFNNSVKAYTLGMLVV